MCVFVFSLSRFIALVSGLSVGNPKADPLSLQVNNSFDLRIYLFLKVLIDYLTGFLGGDEVLITIDPIVSE